MRKKEGKKKSIVPTLSQKIVVLTGTLIILSTSVLAAQRPRFFFDDQEELMGLMLILAGIFAIGWFIVQSHESEKAAEIGTSEPKKDEEQEEASTHPPAGKKPAPAPSKPGDPKSPKPPHKHKCRPKDNKPSPTPFELTAEQKKDPGYEPHPPKKIMFPQKPDDGKVGVEVPKKPPIADDEVKRVDLSRKGLFYPIRNQHHYGACAAFAATSMFEFFCNRKLHSPGKDERRKLSELFLWYNTRYNKNKNEGCFTPKLVVSMYREGVCEESHWPFEVGTDKWKEAPGDDAIENAFLHLIKDCHLLSPDDPDQWVHMLDEMNPVYVAFNWRSNITGKTLYDTEDIPHGTMLGGHAMVIVGYYSHYPHPKKCDGVKAFKIRNSWGAGWGENGYFWITADALKQLTMEWKSPLRVLAGWHQEKDMIPVEIIGRVIKHPEHTNWNKEPGRWLYTRELSKPESKLACTYEVQVLGEIGGKIQPIAATQTNEDGLFKLSFRFNPQILEKLDSVFFGKDPHDPGKRLKGLSSLKEPGLLLAAVNITLLKDGKRLAPFFHVVNFKDSFLGRGGEYKYNKDNPRSDYRSNKPLKLNHSGRPITFSREHRKEMYVIIPVVEPKEMIDELKKEKEK